MDYTVLQIYSREFYSMARPFLFRSGFADMETQEQILLEDATPFPACYSPGSASIISIVGGSK